MCGVIKNDGYVFHNISFTLPKTILKLRKNRTKVDGHDNFSDYLRTFFC